MTWIPNVFRRRKLYDDLSEEMSLHIEERAEKLMGEGMSRTEAEQAARRAFGNRTLVEERSREVWQWPTLESIWADVRFALRQLRRSPGLTIAAVLTLALAIGANAVVFGLLNALILRPLNVPHSESLYTIEHGPDKVPGESYLDYLDLRDRNRSFDSLALFGFVTVGLDTGKNPAQAMGYEVSGNYFDALGIQPYRGRFFHSTDEHGPNSAPYLVISYPYWHSHFQDDRGVVGRVVQINKHPFTILGVAPPSFQGTLLFFFPVFWSPLVNHQQFTGQDILDVRDEQDFAFALGHLKAGVAPAQAIADLNHVGAWLEKTYPKTDAQMSFTLARPSLAGDMLGPPVQGFLAGLMLLAGLILLAACANLGSLFAARAADRSREVALRLALGSSRRRILRAVFTEAVLISLAGGAVGLLGSVALLRELSVWHPIPTYPIIVPAYPDAHVYWAALLLALASGFLFGAVPVRQILRTNPYEVVKAGSTGAIAGNSGQRVNARDVLLVMQISICAVLVTSSLVAVRGLMQSMHSNFGFEPRNAMLVNTDFNMAGYTGDQAPAMERRMIETLKAIPGVKTVGSIDSIPLGGGAPNEDVFTDETTDLSPSKAAAHVMDYKVSPGYFRAAGTAFVRGRDLSWHDDKNSPQVAVINEAFARRIFGSVDSALGGYFKPEIGPRLQVVGIVENGKYSQLTEDQKPTMFVSILQSPSSPTCLVVRSERDPQQLAAAIRSDLREMDAGLPFQVHTWPDALSIALFPSRVATVALGALGTMGAMLAITGIFGLAAYSVSKRLRELGIRIALGAKRKEVLQTALGWPLKLLAFGSAAGLILGVLATRVLAFIVYQANPRDPLVLCGVIAAMAFLGLVATWLPAQRALSVNPMILLREE
ncbi:MAG: ABC transporter permease [Terracidiphilus sp.]|jgi:predicted permease